jgi:hypothetical protein
MNDLQGIANAVLRRAERQGYVVPREIRGELADAGLAEARWKEVVELARESLSLRNGRYYYLSAASPRREQQERQQHTVREAVAQVIAHYQDRSAPTDRRQDGRVNFIVPVEVRTEDGKVLRLLSRDLSPTGIRLIGTRGLLGHKVRVVLPQGVILLARILWTGEVGDGLFENGGTFLEVAAADESNHGSHGKHG